MESVEFGKAQVWSYGEYVLSNRERRNWVNGVVGSINSNSLGGSGMMGPITATGGLIF